MTNSQISKAIQDYKKLRKANPDLQIQHCIEQGTFRDAIRVAAQSINSKNKLHSHQYRVGRKKLNTFADKVMSCLKELEKADSFDKIYSIVSNIKMAGIGTLTRYDITLRIGAKKELFPDKIYLHAGTRIGAEKLVSNIKNKKFIYKHDLPSVLRNSDLTPEELEDILCCFIAKEKFCGCLVEKPKVC